MLVYCSIEVYIISSQNTSSLHTSILLYNYFHLLKYFLQYHIISLRDIFTYNLSYTIYTLYYHHFFLCHSASSWSTILSYLSLSLAINTKPSIHAHFHYSHHLYLFFTGISLTNSWVWLCMWQLILLALPLNIPCLRWIHTNMNSHSLK